MSKPIFASDSDAIPTWFLLCRVLRGEIPLPPELHPGPIPEDYNSDDDYDSPSNGVGEIWTDPEYTVADVATYHAISDEKKDTEFTVDNAAASHTINDEENEDHITEMTYTTAMQQEMMGNESEEDDVGSEHEAWVEDDVSRAYRKLRQLFESKLANNGTGTRNSGITTSMLGFAISFVKEYYATSEDEKRIYKHLRWDNVVDDIEHHIDTLTMIVVTGFNHVSVTIHTTISQCYGWLCNDGIIKPLSWHLDMTDAFKSDQLYKKKRCVECGIYDTIIDNHEWMSGVKNRVRDYIVNNDIVAMFPMIEFHPRFRRDGAKVVGDMLYDEELLPVPQGVAAIIGDYY